jgi:hypothetical protein
MCIFKNKPSFASDKAKADNVNEADLVTASFKTLYWEMNIALASAEQDIFREELRPLNNRALISA